MTSTMKILHGTWIPDLESTFVQRGTFCLWIETSHSHHRKKGQLHPQHLLTSELNELLGHELGIKPKPLANFDPCFGRRSFVLPTHGDHPLPSLELARYLEQDLPETFEYQVWNVDCYLTAALYGVSLLQDLHFITLYNLANVHLGADLLFWYHYTQALKQVLIRDQYIPALRYREIAAPKSQSRSSQAKREQGESSKMSRRSAKASKNKSDENKKETRPASAPQVKLYPGWEWIGDRYHRNLDHYSEAMPLMCVAGFATAPETPIVYDRQTLLQHFSDSFLTELMEYTQIPQTMLKTVANTLIEDCLTLKLTHLQPISTGNLEVYQQWRTWRDRISHSQDPRSFDLYFQLQEPNKPEDPWFIQFLVAPKQDPSLRLSLLDFWRLRKSEQVKLRQYFGENFEQHLLLNLGYAARIYTNFWQGLETDEPVGIFVDLDTAFDFLKEAAWVLEEAGYKVIVPAWWTPQGRQRAKIRLQARGKSSGSSSNTKSYFSYDTLVDYQYQLAIGDHDLNEQEWQELVQAKVPLVHFRGEWIELDPEKMQQMLDFWKTKKAKNPDMSLLEFMKLTAEGEDTTLEVNYERDSVLTQMLSQLSNKSSLEIMAEPPQFCGNLREYQKRGLAWLNYLERLGLNGCLADDMGLGKTVQVIAHLVQERETAAIAGIETAPTLLIAPTSVLGNWFHELQKFAPHLRAAIHHGPSRATASEDFQTMTGSHDVIITSFSLIRKDVSLLTSVTWQRIVLDEAQNIKNPTTAQTKAILKLNAHHRLALTGTPVENRLMDLWSIFNFLNPGYLGKQTQFRKAFELPIQKDNDPRQVTTLKKLVEPLILRRLKTDKSIIKDLPDKVEQKVYCNLTKEQASLYEAVVADVSQNLETTEDNGIQRKGMILATLMKLKQICNHPRQFLQDNSDFSLERSHKLSRLAEMLEEVINEGESALVFTQFREIGEALNHFLKQERYYNTYYIHGGTPRQKREKMIAEFQDGDTAPSIFILSLKAAGVGITLTKANHVFHFDRWWNPAVEDQATDRAFRIGQEKNVFVHKFVALGTLEERIDEMIEDKKKLAGAIVGADESWLSELDNESFKALISLNRSAILE